MAGHSKWHNIKHRKAAVDKKRGKVWTKCAKAIIVAAKNGGPDPASNLTLRYAIDEARYANMPRDTIERAIKKGAGGLEGDNYEAVRYEGYGPGGVAIIIDALTDNRTRTVGDIRLAFAKYGGNLGSTGCVGYMFEAKGQIAAAPGKLSGDALMEIAIEAGAEDVEPPEDAGDEDVWMVTTGPTEMLSVKDRLEAGGAVIADGQITMVPGNRVAARGDQARDLLALIDALEDLDDVQKVYTNLDVPDDEAAVEA